MRADKMDHPNEGVVCTVNTCYYYMKGDHCCASQIIVEPKDSLTSEQTDCATFYYTNDKS